MKKKKLVVLGIDQSLRNTAFCISQYEREKKTNHFKLEVRSFEKVKTTIKKKGEQKAESLMKMKNLFEIFFKTVNTLNYFSPDIIVLENYNFMGVRNLTLQAEVTSAILIAINFYHRRIREEKLVFFVSPQSLKKFVLGKGVSQKKQFVLKEVLKKYNLDLNDDNEADAFVLSEIGFNYYNQFIEKVKSKNLLSYQEEVLKTINKNIEEKSK